MNLRYFDVHVAAATSKASSDAGYNQAKNDDASYRSWVVGAVSFLLGSIGRADSNRSVPPDVVLQTRLRDLITVTRRVTPRPSRSLGKIFTASPWP
ncbi:hypothetical protein BG58_09400 [Caballeronia jiangsuensis]|nr:hypothetical protein BG58_09400 [Caballeronia jiangsuensis]